MDTFFSFLEWLDTPVRVGIFVSRTREKLGRTCDQIGRTLEPCSAIYTVYENMVIVVLWMCELLSSSVSLN